MLATIAVRAISGRGTTSALRTSCPLHRFRLYASDATTSGTHQNGTHKGDGEKKDSSQNESKNENKTVARDTKPPFKKGPYRRNTVWGPNMREGVGHNQQNQRTVHNNSRSVSSFSSLSQRRTFASKSSKRSRSNQTEDATSEPDPLGRADQERSSSSDYQSWLRTRSEASHNKVEASEEPNNPAQPTGPLPDLRHGIPSSFEHPTSDTASSFKDEDTQAPALDIAAASASSGGRSDEDTPKEAYVSSIERRRNAIAYYMFLGAGVAGLAGVLYLGRDWESQTEANAHPDVPNGYTPAAVYHRVTERLGNLFGYYTEPAFEKLLPDPSPDPNFRAPYTLVLSLEDLLVSSKWDRSNGYKVAKRPGVDYFLRYMSQYYELVIFTTVLPMNGDTVLRKLDPFRFCLPLFRDATRYMEGEHVKDLSFLNRDLSKTLIIDTVPAHVKLQPENAIVLPKWKGDAQDAHGGDLVALIPFLEYIASMSIDDVRKFLKSYEGTHIPTEFHRRESLAREEFNKGLGEERSKRPRSAMGLAGLSSALGFRPSQGMMVVPGEQTPFEGFAEGKMLSDQMRERGKRAYQEMEKQIQENGETWLKQQEDEEKKMQEEASKNITGWLPSFGGTSSGGNSEKRN